MTTSACFNSLPPELRHQIWSYAIQSLPPRIITLYTDARLQKENPPPGILHTCRESREIALRSYELSLGNGPRYGTYECGLGPPGAKDIYVNFAQDLIYLPQLRVAGSSEPSAIPSENRPDHYNGTDYFYSGDFCPNVGILRTQRFATEIAFRGTMRIWICNFLCEFPNLKELYIVYADHLKDEDVEGHLRSVFARAGQFGIHMREEMIQDYRIHKPADQLEGPVLNLLGWLSVLRSTGKRTSARLQLRMRKLGSEISEDGQYVPMWRWKIVGKPEISTLFQEITGQL